jgi:hypothetical protein
MTCNHPDFKITENHKIFNYNEALTKKLDAIEIIDQTIINEIILWKVNRYASIDKGTFLLINDAKSYRQIDCYFTKKLLTELLSVDGIRLPMASTILRFANPNVYQIIDQRVYRTLYGTELKLPLKNKKKGFNTEIETYLDYLNKLREVSEDLKISFKDADRILFLADKEYNKDVRLNNY